MYFEALAIAAELRDYPGGPEVLAKSIYPTIEGMRIIRWPADRLDTLGGYLAYHNIVLFNFFLAIFAAIQGARLLRALEENRTIEFYLATGLSRRRIIILRANSYFFSQLLISLALGIATAFALASSNEANTKGAIITLLAGGICILPFFGLGLLISQFVNSAKTASGVTSIVVTLIYVVDNISGKFEWLSWFKFLSPFYYANLSRPVIPGFDANYWAWLLMIFVCSIFIAISILLVKRRDLESTVFQKPNINTKEHNAQVYVPRTLVGDILYRQRLGIFAWMVTVSTFIGVFISMLNGIVGIWKEFAFLDQFSSYGFGNSPEEQYLALVFEVLPPFLAAFVITQSSKWTSDLNQGRVQLLLSTPITWSGLILRRVVATFLGALLIIVFSTATTVVGGVLQDVEINMFAVFRVFVMSILFVLAFSAINALLVAILRGKNPTHFISIYVGAAWLIGFMAPYLNWPSWIVRFSVFEAFGHPFVQWPAALNISLILVMSGPVLLSAMYLAERSPKN